MFSTNVESFAIYFFPHFMKYDTPTFHKEIYEDLPKNPYLAVAAPRGHAKTTIGLLIYPIWWALFKRTGDVSILSASEDFVIREITGKIKKEFENNERIKLFFGDMKTAKWTESYFVLKNGIAFEGGGIGGQLRGGRRGLIGLDDLENIETVRSEEQREKLKERINKELIPKLLPDGQMIYFGTLIHQLCYLKQLLDTPNNGWKKRIYKAYVDDIQEEGHELWGAMYPHSLLQDRKAKIGSTAFSSEYLNNPLNAEDARFKSEWFKYYERLPDKIAYFMTIDPAISESDRADYSVVMVCALDDKNNLYVVHYIRQRMTKLNLINAIFNTYNQYRPQRVGVESVAFQKMLYNDLQDKSRQTGKHIPFEELRPDTSKSKEMRIMALQPRFENGSIYLRRDMAELEEELIQFPQSKHDDVLDALAYQLNIIQPYYYEEAKRIKDAEERPQNLGATGYGDDY